MDLRTVNELVAGSVGGAAQVLGTVHLIIDLGTTTEHVSEHTFEQLVNLLTR